MKNKRFDELRRASVGRSKESINAQSEALSDQIGRLFSKVLLEKLPRLTPKNEARLFEQTDL